MFPQVIKKIVIAAVLVGLVFTGLSLFVVGAKAITISPLIYEFEGRPGDILIGLMKIANENDDLRTYYSSVENFIAGGEGGEPSFVKQEDTEYGLAAWITVQEKEITLLPKEKRSVIFEINVPANAEPGGYYSAVFWSTQPSSNTGNAVGAAASTGSLVLLRVTGEAKEEINVANFGSKDGGNFFTHLPITFLTRLENKGNVHEKPRGAIVIKNMLGQQSKVLNFNPNGGNVLPQSARRFENTWQKNPENTADSEWKKEWNNFGLGRYTAVLSLQFGVGNEKTFTATYHFWVISWQVTLFWLLVVAPAFLLLRFITKRYNRWIISRFNRK